MILLSSHFLWQIVIGPREVEIQKEKVEEVLNWPAPRNVKKVQKFLDLVNYYRRFIKDFVSQKVTYLFCNELDIDSKSFISRVRQATKDVVKSEV